jgi:hypothetical protein
MEVHMAPLLRQQFVAYIGIDWADTKHDVCIQAANGNERVFGCVQHQVARIDKWAKAMRQRYGSPIAVALELAKGPIVAALQKYDFFVLFPINPSTLAKYREAFKLFGVNYPDRSCCLRVAPVDSLPKHNRCLTMFVTAHGTWRSRCHEHSLRPRGGSWSRRCGIGIKRHLAMQRRASCRSLFRSAAITASRQSES